MNVEELINNNKLLEEENKELKEKLKKYSAPARHKKYYENHKQELLEKIKNTKCLLKIKKEKKYTDYSVVLTA